MKEKYVKGYFALSRLLVSEFLLFNVFQRPGVPDFGVVGPEAWVLSPKSRVLGPGSWVLLLDYGLPRSWVSDPGSWVLILDYAFYYSYIGQSSFTFLVHEH